MPDSFHAFAPLEHYGHNLTTLARQGAFPPLAGTDAVASRVFQILQRRSKNNPVIIAPDSTRRWEVVAEIVRQMAVGHAPDPLPAMQVIALDYEALFANLSDDTLIRQEHITHIARNFALESESLAPLKQESHEAWLARVKGLPIWPKLEEWILHTMVLERLAAIFTAMRQAPGSFLLFVDHFHRLVGGEWEDYPIDAATILMPLLARNQIQLLGACTLEQYRPYIERDAALQRRFQEVCLPPAP